MNGRALVYVCAPLKLLPWAVSLAFGGQVRNILKHRQWPVTHAHTHLPAGCVSTGTAQIIGPLW